MMAKSTIPQVLPLLQAYYEMEGNSLGGSLHVVLDDGNVDDGTVEFCHSYAMREHELVGGHLVAVEPDRLGAALALVLLAMSKTQRRKLGCLIRR